MKLKQMEQAIQAERDKYALELFNKHEWQLDTGENWRLDEYIKDIRNPKWGIVETRHGDRVEVSNSGKRARDPVTKKEYHIVYPIVNNKSWYPFINVDGASRKYQQSVHRLIAQAFVENPDPVNKTDINHINGVKTCNWYRNLEWVTKSENSRLAFQTGLMHPAKGEDSPSTIYTNEQIKQVCQLLQDRPDMSYKEIAKETGVSKAQVGYIYRNFSRKDISKNYAFAPRETTIKGEKQWKSKYTNDQIRQVCELLVAHPDWTFEKIGQETGVNGRVVQDIHAQKTRKDISANYVFKAKKKGPSPETNGHTEVSVNQVREVCKMLDDRYFGINNRTNQQIADQVGISRYIVDHISSGSSWLSISKEYKFLRKE